MRQELTEEFVKRAKDHPETECFELWGNDTYSNETYFCGLYLSSYDADKEADKLRKEACKTASKGLEDTYWVEKTTLGTYYENYVRDNDSLKKSREQIKIHHNYLTGMCPYIRCFVRNSIKCGRHKLLVDDSKARYIQDFYTELSQFKHGSIRRYKLYVGLNFRTGWHGARLSGYSMLLCKGTLDEIRTWVDKDENFYDVFNEMKKKIEDYFFCDC